MKIIAIESPDDFFKNLGNRNKAYTVIVEKKKYENMSMVWSSDEHDNEKIIFEKRI